MNNNLSSCQSNNTIWKKEYVPEKDHRHAEDKWLAHLMCYANIICYIILYKTFANQLEDNKHQLGRLWHTVTHCENIAWWGYAGTETILKFQFLDIMSVFFLQDLDYYIFITPYDPFLQHHRVSLINNDQLYM